MIIKNCKCFNGEKFLSGLKDIVIQDKFITGIFPAGLKEMPTEVLDAAGKTISPGYIDIHTHGIGGYDNTDLCSEDLVKMIEIYNMAGTTTFIPSLPAISNKKIQKALGLYSQNRHIVRGVHMEGPYLNEGKKRCAEPNAYIHTVN